MIDEDRDDDDCDGDYEHGASPLVMYEIVDEDKDNFGYEDNACVAYFIKIIVLQKIMQILGE